jgi:hypothetical protein
MVEARLGELLSYSAHKLQGMDEFGYSWKNYRPLSSSNLSYGDAPGSNKSPIALSSDSDSEDDVPLSRRVKQSSSDTLVSEEDVPLADRRPGFSNASQYSKSKMPAKREQDKRWESDHQGAHNHINAQPKREPGLGAQGESGRSREGVRELSKLGTRPGEWEHISQHKAPLQPQAKSSLHRATTRPHAQASPADSVIDLEADEMDPISPPYKAGFRVTTLKSLQRTDPNLGRAVSDL